MLWGGAADKAGTPQIENSVTSPSRRAPSGPEDAAKNQELTARTSAAAFLAEPCAGHLADEVESSGDWGVAAEARGCLIMDSFQVKNRSGKVCTNMQ
jgi:hypothetical protein